MGEGRTVDAPLEAFRKSAHHGRRRRYPGKRRRNGRRRHSCRWREATAVVVAPTVGVRRPDVHHRPKLRFDGIAGAAGRLTSPRARMWLGEAPISLMLETSLIHPHTIVSMLINDLADNGNEVFLFLDDYHLVTDPAIRGAVSFLLRYAHRIFTWSLQHAWSHRYRFADCLPRTGCSRSIPLTCALTTPSQGRSRLVALAFIRRAPTAR